MVREIVETLLPDGFCISDDPARLDHDLIYGFLSTHAYWAIGRERAVNDAAIAGGHCFGVYGQNGQVGFARVVTDYVTLVWIADVFILPKWQGQGLGRALVQAIVDHSRLTGVRRMMLVTSDAHGLYGQFGFTPLEGPERYMTRMR